jgi:hypothetical protein
MTPDQELPEREQRVADLLLQARANTRAPDSLRVQVEAMRRPRAARPAPAVRWRVGFAGAMAVVVAALVITLGGGAAAAPNLRQVTALAGRGPAGPAPGALPSASTTLLTAAVGNLHFPNWQAHGGWRSSGERIDTIGGRTVKTVFYSRSGTRLAYSIVAAPTLPESRSGSDPYVVLRDGSRVSVIWTVQNHTCVLSGTGVSPSSLWHLAATTLD